MRFVRYSLLLIFTFYSVPVELSAGSGLTYKHLTVKSFESGPTDQIPPDFREALRDHLLKQLRHTNRFQDITILDAGNSIPPDTDIVLSGKIVKFDKGNRMERYMVPGMGSTSIRALIEYTDPASGKSLFKTEVGGKVAFGVLGGDSKGATNGLAKGLAKATKRNLP